MDRLYSISHRALMRASLAVLLIDDLTGKPITGSNARAWIEGAKPPVKKSDGWNVFLELPRGSYTVIAEGGMYCRTSAEAAVSEGVGTLLLRLSPNRLYRLPSGCVRIEGQAAPGTQISVYAQGKQPACKLLKDSPAGSTEVTLFCSGDPPVGKLLRFSSPEGVSETVRLTAPGEAPDLYQLSAPLENAYPRAGTLIAPVTLTEADDKGRFFAVVRCTSPEGTVTVEGGGVSKEYQRSDVLTVSLVD